MEEQSLSLVDLELQIDDSAGASLKKTAKWTRITSIVFIVFTAIIFICVLIMLAFRSSMVEQWNRSGVSYPGIASTGAGIFNVLAGAFLFMLCMMCVLIFLLLRFSNQTKKGIETNDQAMLESGVASLKNYMIITGVVTSLSVLNGLYQFIKIFL